MCGSVQIGGGVHGLGRGGGSGSRIIQRSRFMAHFHNPTCLCELHPGTDTSCERLTYFTQAVLGLEQEEGERGVFSSHMQKGGTAAPFPDSRALHSTSIHSRQWPRPWPPKLQLSSGPRTCFWYLLSGRHGLEIGALGDSMATPGPTRQTDRQGHGGHDAHSMLLPPTTTKNTQTLLLPKAFHGGAAVVKGYWRGEPSPYLAAASLTSSLGGAFSPRMGAGRRRK